MFGVFSLFDLELVIEMLDLEDLRLTLCPHNFTNLTWVCKDMYCLFTECSSVLFLSINRQWQLDNYVCALNITGSKEKMILIVFLSTL